MINLQTLGRGLAIACVLAASAYSAESHAANVGYFGSCGSGDRAAIITAAGHTPVPVASITSTTLTGLAALWYEPCGYSPNAVIDSAVANGMTLVVNDWGTQGSGRLPGTPTFGYASQSNNDTGFPVGSPLLNGPGGALNNTSIDDGYSSYHNYLPAGAPAGASAYVTTGVATQVIAFAYPHGTGRVYYSTMPLGHYMPGGIGSFTGRPVVAGMQAFAKNLVAWAAGPSFTTCAATGFVGSKLTMCHKICETTQTPTALSGLIRIYRSAYREDPPCAN